MVDEPHVPLLPLEYIVANNQTKSDAFNKVGEGIQCEPNGCQSNPNETPATKNTPLDTPAITTSLFQFPTTTSPSQFPTNSSTPQTEVAENSPQQTEPADSENANQVSSDHVDEESDSIDSDVESDHVAVFDNPDGDDGSDIHEEVKTFRAERRAYKRRTRREKKGKSNPDDVPLGEVEQDIGFDETEPNNRGLEGRVGGDEPFYFSSNACSCTSEEDDVEEGVNLKARRESKYIRFDPACKKVVWQLSMIFQSVNEFRDAVTRYSLQKHIPLDKFVNEPSTVKVTCRDGCPWLIYAKLDNSTKNFQIKTYYPKHKCV
ncbi:uncharacterized protein LOC132645289 isoform X1 [Lycium barbarum]|uniref:uncharacterized protein LOC132645289 isoform X1 n=1 Tax=Lycium barbarum TaxID=112863 RepID=UPI00293F11C6|nr:uncharacterized protein LOC132645289 isoform X1 [Lycium barbarum]